jgi:hypothetical protein
MGPGIRSYPSRTRPSARSASRKSQETCLEGPLNKMNTRHATALALVGWYLLIPPIPTNPSDLLQFPLAQWEQFGAYDTAKECESAKEELAKAAVKDEETACLDSPQSQWKNQSAEANSGPHKILPAGRGGKPTGGTTAGAVLKPGEFPPDFKPMPSPSLRCRYDVIKEDSRCVSTDDPRLKEK